MINENESELLRKWLPSGAYIELSAELGFSHGFVAKVAKGERNNEIILSRLIKMALKNKKKIDKTVAELQKLAS